MSRKIYIISESSIITFLKVWFNKMFTGINRWKFILHLHNSPFSTYCYLRLSSLLNFPADESRADISRAAITRAYTK